MKTFDPKHDLSDMGFVFVDYGNDLVLLSLARETDVAWFTDISPSFGFATDFASCRVSIPALAEFAGGYDQLYNDNTVPQLLAYLKAHPELIKPAWPRKYQVAAQNAGWDIFSTSDARDDRDSFQLQAIAAPSDDWELDYDEPKFPDDQAAAEWVKDAARAGDETAIAACAFLVAREQLDAEKFDLASALPDGHPNKREKRKEANEPATEGVAG